MNLHVFKVPEKYREKHRLFERDRTIGTTFDIAIEPNILDYSNDDHILYCVPTIFYLKLCLKV